MPMTIRSDCILVGLRQDFSCSTAFANHGFNRDTGRALGRRKRLRVGEEPVATHRSQGIRLKDHRRRTHSGNRELARRHGEL